MEHNELKTMLRYDPITGDFTWIGIDAKAFASESAHRAWCSKYAGRTAGAINPLGYVIITYRRKTILAHRLAWEFVNGPVPSDKLIDHVNGDRSDNRIGNIRLATAAQNSTNRRIASHNKSGLKGVQKNSNGDKWCAQIRFGGKARHLGSFANKLLAYDAYVNAAISTHGEFAQF